MSVSLEGPETSTRPSARNIALLVCCVAGLGVSIYLTTYPLHEGREPGLLQQWGDQLREGDDQPAVDGLRHPTVAVLGLVFFVSMFVLPCCRVSMSVRS